MIPTVWETNPNTWFKKKKKMKNSDIQQCKCLCPCGFEVKPDKPQIELETLRKELKRRLKKLKENITICHDIIHRAFKNNDLEAWTIQARLSGKIEAYKEEIIWMKNKFGNVKEFKPIFEEVEPKAKCPKCREENDEIKRT